MSVLSATIALSQSTVLINQSVTATVTVSNTAGGSNLTITSIVPQVNFTGGAGNDVPVAAGAPNLGPAAAVQVAPSGSTSFPISMNFFAPSTGPIGAGTGTYSVSAICTSLDGQVFSPTAATITVNPLPLPVSQQ